MSRGQAFSLDLIIGAAALLILLTAYAISLSDIAMRTGSFEAARGMRVVALEASSALAESPGESAAWQALPQANATVLSLGLAGQARVLDSAKLSRLASMDYNETKTLLGLAGFDYRLSVLASNGTLLYSAGAAPVPEVQSIVSERVVLYNSSPAKLKLEVWR